MMRGIYVCLMLGLGLLVGTPVEAGLFRCKGDSCHPVLSTATAPIRWVRQNRYEARQARQTQRVASYGSSGGSTQALPSSGSHGGYSSAAMYGDSGVAFDNEVNYSSGSHGGYSSPVIGVEAQPAVEEPTSQSDIPPEVLELVTEKVSSIFAEVLQDELDNYRQQKAEKQKLPEAVGVSVSTMKLPEWSHVAERKLATKLPKWRTLEPDKLPEWNPVELVAVL